MAKIAAKELKRMLDEGEDFLLLDVRPYAGFLQSHIKGAKSVPSEELEREMGKLDKSKVIVVYCSGPRCPLSGFAHKKLSQAGFDVRHFEGGMKEWTEQEFPVESG